MKTKIIGILLLITGQSFSQGFVNLNFESAKFKTDPGGFFPPNSVYASNAIPGWTAYLDGVPQTDVLSNQVTLGSAMVSLQGTNPPSSNFFVEPALQGRWSIFLQGLFGDTNTFTGGYPIIAAIGQTAQVPATANSLMFWAYFPYQMNFFVSLDGQNLSVTTVSSGLNYNVYGVDVSAFAGQTSELRFTVGGFTYAELDNIFFSSSSVPEPSTLALGALGALLFGFRRWRNFGP